jgi:N-acyl-D-aspartate/D-glutamate deacylase
VDHHLLNIASRIISAPVRVIDGSGAEPFAGHVLVERNRIKSVGREGPAAAGDAVVVDGSGATLMPGLVEVAMFWRDFLMLPGNIGAQSTRWEPSIGAAISGSMFA